MNERQRTALAHPCGRAPEILHSRFWRVEKSPMRGQLLTSGLTVNR